MTQTQNGAVSGWTLHRLGGVQPGVVLHVPHASRAIPGDVRTAILLDDAALDAELAAMTDRHTDRLALSGALLAEVPTALFVNRWSRLVVDPERFADDALEQMASIGMGAVYRSTSQLAPLREPDTDAQRRLVGRFFDPYADAFADLVDQMLDAVGHAIIIDVHSYPSRPLPYEREPNAARPEICLGTDLVHTTPELLDAATKAFAGFDVGHNTPFAGTYVALRHYQRDPRVWSIMVEARRDTYLDEDTGTHHDGIDRLVGALAGLVRSSHELCHRGGAVDHRPPEVPAGLRRTYVQTVVSVDGDNGRLSAHAAVEQLGEPLYIITAANPFGTMLSEDDNRARHESLGDVLIASGCRPYPAVGSSPDGNWSEESWAVTGIGSATARRIGRAFEQNAVFELSGYTQRVLGCFGDWAVERQID